jgi:hypothetical protein
MADMIVMSKNSTAETNLEEYSKMFNFSAQRGSYNTISKNT